MRYIFFFFIGLIVMISESSGQMKTNCDLIIYGGLIYTMDEYSTEAQAMAIGKGKILAIGTLNYIFEQYTSERKIKISGQVIFPGFIDAHSHFYGYAMGLQQVDLLGSRSFEEVLIKMRKSSARTKEKWLIGRGWDQNLWSSKTFPDRHQLDSIYPDRPVVLIRVDGHVVLANEEAIRRSGIELEKKFLPGEIELKNGRMTGIFSENAADFMRNSIPDPSLETRIELLKRAEQNCFSAGLTSVTDAGLDYTQVKLIDSLQRSGSLRIRVNVMLNPTEENRKKFIEKGPFRTDNLNIRSIKLYADGSLGSRTALLKKGYEDAPGNYGIMVNRPEQIRETCRIAMKNGYQMCCHAIGDSGVRNVLVVYSEFLKQKNDLRWRIEHAQVVDSGDLHLFRKFSVIPSVQATHATSDMLWAGERLGPTRVRWAYAYRNLLKQNGWLANGTDFPIEGIEPLGTFYAAVARKDKEGLPSEGFQKENAINREEALRSMTIWAAKASFEERFKGSLEPGKAADFVILDKDILQVTEADIPKARVISTYLAGKLVTFFGYIK